jgi:hypothetical protein
VIVNDVIQILTGVTTLVTAAGIAVVTVRTAKIKKLADDTQKVGKETHAMVNSRMDAMMALLEKQRTALQGAGVVIPLDDSIPHSHQSSDRDT